MNTDFGNKRPVSRESWEYVAYQDVGDAWFFYDEYHSIERLAANVVSFRENHCSPHLLDPLIAEHPEFAGLLDGKRGFAPLETLRHFESRFEDGPTTNWFLRVRGGFNYEILDMDDPEEDPTTDRLFVNRVEKEFILHKFCIFVDRIERMIVG
jgi:hypothetical protein